MCIYVDIFSWNIPVYLVWMWRVYKVMIETPTIFKYLTLRFMICCPIMHEHSLSSFSWFCTSYAFVPLGFHSRSGLLHSVLLESSYSVCSLRNCWAETRTFLRNYTLKLKSGIFHSDIEIIFRIDFSIFVYLKEGSCLYGSYWFCSKVKSTLSEGNQDACWRRSWGG